MRIAIYGLPCAGKTYLMHRISEARIIHGSDELKRLSPAPFSDLSEDEKNLVRIKYTEYLKSLTDDVVVSDGHYSFLEDVVFTEADGEVYDVFFYLYCEPQVILDRMEISEKNKKYASLAPEVIKQWQLFEIESLREECHKRNKEFYVISDNDKKMSGFNDFLGSVVNGFSTYKQAMGIVKQIMAVYPKPGDIKVVDGDRTLILQDSFRFCCDGKTEVFDGNFYTGYQAFLFERELRNLHIATDKVGQIRLNPFLKNVLDEGKYVVVSSGISSLWNAIADSNGLKNVFANTMISADTKYYIVKILKEAGYKVTAYGDSKIDLYMLRASDKGILYIGKRISRSLQGVDLSGIALVYDQEPFVLVDEGNPDVLNDISVCKSASGINGGRLASAHIRLGSKIGEKISQVVPEIGTAVVVLERGGRFFGDGIYSAFGGTFYSFNPAKDDIPAIPQRRVIIVDSVINTGKSTIRMVERIKSSKSSADIIIATNVIQEDAVPLFKDYKLFAVRVSSNSFVGENQAKQTGKIGPDTADRLFNIIEERFRVKCSNS